MKKIQILNTGGTFNKQYNLLNGNLEIYKNNNIIKNILSKIYLSNKLPDIKGIIFKDSLDITNKDREDIVKFIQKSEFKNIIIVHGTDTMDKTAKLLAKNIKNKTVVLVGAMKPFSYDNIEATGNLCMAIGFLKAKPKSNIYISMSGIVKKYDKIQKNYKKGLFECL